MLMYYNQVAPLAQDVGRFADQCVSLKFIPRIMNHAPSSPDPNPDYVHKIHNGYINNSPTLRQPQYRIMWLQMNCRLIQFIPCIMNHAPSSPDPNPDYVYKIHNGYINNSPTTDSPPTPVSNSVAPDELQIDSIYSPYHEPRAFIA